MYKARRMPPARITHTPAAVKMRTILLPLAAVLLACFGPVVQCGVELSDDQKELMKQLRATCMEETGVQEPTIDACVSGNFADDQKLKCYFKCVFQQMTVMDDDGLIDVDTMVSMLPEDIQAKAEGILNACKDVRGADACGNAFEFNKCLYAKAPEYYFTA